MKSLSPKTMEIIVYQKGVFFFFFLSELNLLRKICSLLTEVFGIICLWRWRVQKSLEVPFCKYHEYNFFKKLRNNS